jgi:hypothetical protein
MCIQIKEKTLLVQLLNNSFSNVTLCGKRLTRTELLHIKFLIQTVSKDVFYDLARYIHLLNDPLLSTKTNHSDQGAQRSHLPTQYMRQGHFRHVYMIFIA